MVRRLAIGLLGLGVLAAGSGCWHHHQYVEAQKEAFAQRVADKCADAARPPQVIVVPSGAQVVAPAAPQTR